MVLWRSIRPYLSAFVRYMHIAYIEAKSEYQRSYLGLLWVPLSSIVFALMLALIFRHSDVLSPLEFFMYVLTGYVTWSFISESLGGSTDIIQKRLEFAVHNGLSVGALFIKVLIDRLFLYFLNLVVVVICLVLLFPNHIGTNLLLFFPFLTFLVITSLAVSYLVNLSTILLGDLTNIVKTGTRFLFFASPVFWMASGHTEGIRRLLVDYNPAAYYLEIVRQVFAIQPFDGFAWIVTGLITAALALIGWVAFKRSEKFVRNMR